MWTKEQYINWKQTRGEAGTWKYEDCANADELIEQEALKAFEAFLPKSGPITDFFRVCVKAHMGSIECDQMLTKLHCYPDWM